MIRFREDTVALWSWGRQCFTYRSLCWHYPIISPDIRCQFHSRTELWVFSFYVLIIPGQRTLFVPAATNKVTKAVITDPSSCIWSSYVMNPTSHRITLKFWNSHSILMLIRSQAVYIMYISFPITNTLYETKHLCRNEHLSLVIKHHFSSA